MCPSYSVVSNLYASFRGLITLGWGKRELFFLLPFLELMWFLFRGVSSSSWCLEWAALFYCDTPWSFHI